MRSPPSWNARNDVREVVVTGLGAVTPLGAGAHTLHERWAAGVCAVSDGEAPCADFDPLSTMTRKEARRADRFTQFALAAADEALANAGLSPGDPDVCPERIGSIVGTGIGGLATLESNGEQLIARGPAAVSPLAVPLMMGNAGAAAIALRHGLLGPCFGVVSACAAGTNAIGSALRAIQAGEADVIVTGGAEAALTPLSRASFAALEATSEVGISRPFDVRRDGFVMGEGAGMLVLEAAESAQARGARPLGRIAGYATTCDAYHLTAPDPEGAGAARAIAGALRDAGIEPDGVDYVNAHGTSTPLNDRAETFALKTALGERAREIPVSSLKSAIGHLLGAAGAVEAVATILALRDRIAPPTLGLDEADPELDLNYVPGVARTLVVPDGRPARAISNSFGFGGHNAVLVLEAA
jgi:3-oxoacyl-[acyl-carrier-protein] synthase II